MFLIPEIQFIALNNDSYMMLNLINAAADILDQKHYNLLINKEFSKIDHSIIELLINRKYLFKTQTEYNEFIETLNHNIYSNELKLPPNFLIIPTYACNLNCIYCYEKTYEIKKLLNHKYLEIFNKQLQFINQFLIKNPDLKPQDITITLMGGEPLLKANKNVVEQILSKLDERKYKVNIVTNGVELDSFIDLLIAYHIQQIQITLDGTKKTHDKRRIYQNGNGSFDSIIKNLELAINKGIKIYLRVNVDKENIDDLPSLADLLIKKFGNTDLLNPYLYLLQDGGCSGEKNVIREIDGIKYIFNQTKKYKNMKIFYKKYHPANFLDAILYNKEFHPLGTHCGASRNQYILDARGDIYRCWHGIGNSNFSIGKFNPEPQFNKNNELWKKRNILEIEKCNTCKYRYLCGTGCPAATHFSEEYYDISKPSCVDYEKLLNTLILLNFN